MQVTVENMDIMNLNFTNKVTVSPPPTTTFNISGLKINNATSSGIQGWNITLLNSTMQKSVLTGADGSYVFMNLVNGTYNVTEETKSGFTNVSPTTVRVTINGSNVMNINFTNTPLILSSIIVSPSTVLMVLSPLNVSVTQMFTTTALDQNGHPMAGVNLSWTSSNTTVGTVSPSSALTDANGTATTTFTALAPGTTMVNATSGNVSGSATVTVTAPPVPLPPVNVISGSVTNVATGMGIPNVTIRLVGIVGTGVDTKSLRMEIMTSSIGNWQFDNLPAGRYTENG